LTLEGIKAIVPSPHNYCYACFDMVYPIAFPGEHFQQMELIL
ncbi:hypothetical protein LCGC14_3112580, partial [marine sediment metagenome]